MYDLRIQDDLWGNIVLVMYLLVDDYSTMGDFVQHAGHQQQ